MRSRRVYDGNNVIFDAKELFANRDDMVLLEMRNGPISYTSEGGVRFWAKHPFQWVSGGEAELLLKSSAPEFREASIDDLEDYYSYD